MGQFLAIGLVTRFSVSKNDLTSANIDLTEFEHTLSEKLNYIVSYFERTESEEYFTYSLTNEQLETEMVPFLRTLYPMLYPDSPAMYTTVLSELSTKTAKEILKYAEDQPEESFQDDGYAMNDRISINKRRISIHYRNIIMLALEGKIVMEEYGKIFAFVKKCMTLALPDQKMASCLRMYITG